MSVTIHPSAVVDPAAKLGEGVSIGPFCAVGPDVALGDGVRLVSHVAVDGRTTIGAGTVIYPFASIGHRPQDLKYHGEPSELVIGARNQIREHVTMNPGTEGGGMITRVGDDGLFMMGSHVAHDCIVGDHVIMANNATLGGHVTLGDYVIIGGLSAVRQFVRIGSHAMIGGMSGVENDVIPFGLVMGDRARLAGLNLVGLERRGFKKDDINALRGAYRMLFGTEGTFAERVEEVGRDLGDRALISDVLDFIRAKESRSLCQPRDA
ncbi:acyl-ACP--UDP-N-acetylglucosamine O-acyltransferase [Azospirillum picis]|uniref:Acyl-[acyl-carrier-protein]--UDP-N-acetylglucosamine O-acyltransferase n=1 Tax=Azospirillum picis TaxID=488438 RepID=A0ABU0MG22_9PROT|nr:acyl-ACP--UDP-N-acetylglucosamine O-acyltransferase [Azospirillum picis]MBP2298571.1 UDP-N-acetylglucosamine acyltransferase [Azospirillum picis]MDQ0532380.1 UDP-N-acetylglucosamine acyltransferase [Azospirillum picis]